MIPTVSARASIGQTMPGDGHQAERIIKFAIGNQRCIEVTLERCKSSLRRRSKLGQAASDFHPPGAPVRHALSIH
jgi:hypothetical protein